MAIAPSTLRIDLLGDLRVFRGGDPVAMPASRKTRALLAYLAFTAREHTRDRLCALLWPDVDDPRGALRWSLSRLRQTLCADGPDPLVATRDTVRLDTDRLEVDALALKRALSGGVAQATTARLAELAALFRAALLEGLDLADAPEFHGWCIAERERFQRCEREVLDALVDRLRDQADAAVPFAERRARLDPNDDAAHARFIGVLGAAGRVREADAHFRAHRRWLERHGGRIGPEIVRAWAALSAAPAPARQDAVARTAGQEVQFCRSRDGTTIAYATAGCGPPLVKAPNWLSHLEHEWTSPVWRHWLCELCREHRLVRNDQRASGLSDWTAEDLSLDAFVDDLEAVMSAAGVHRSPIIGISQGCAIAVAYAIRHPERVSGLVLYGGFALGWAKRRRTRVEATEAMLTLMAHGWGRPHDAFRQLFTSLFFSGATLEQMQAFNALQRESASAENAVRLARAVGSFDITSILPRVRVPTLVLHARDDAVIPFEQGRRLAASIPGARFVALEGSNHILLEHEPAWTMFVAAFREFLSALGRPAAAPGGGDARPW